MSNLKFIIMKEEKEKVETLDSTSHLDDENQLKNSYKDSHDFLSKKVWGRDRRDVFHTDRPVSKRDKGDSL